MARSPVVKIGLTYRDRDSNKAVFTCYCAFDIPIVDAYTYAVAMASRVSAISDALIVAIDLTWRWTIDDPGFAPLGSTIERKILLLMTNEDGEINGIVVPSPSDNWEHTGAYAGIRLDLASAGALAWLDMLAALDLRTEDNRAVGTVLAAGGLAI